MRDTLRNLVTLFAGGVALAGGIYLAEQLRDPYSDVRLWLGTLVDRVREGVKP